MSPYEQASLWPQWISALAAILAVGVAVVFGALTLSNSRRSKDAQDRATRNAAEEPMSADFAEAFEDLRKVNWAVQHLQGERWVLRNIGSSTAYDVSIAGYTDLDKQRLIRAEEWETRGPTELLMFELVSRFSLSGPANIVVTFKTEKDGPLLRRTIRVPAS